MMKEMEVYQFNNILPPHIFLSLFIFFLCSHRIFNSSSLFMSISNMILLYNINMGFFHVFFFGKRYENINNLKLQHYMRTK